MIQKECDLYLKTVGDLHRKHFAQYFTPKQVAQFMTKWVLKENSCHSILDPAFGLGGFWDVCPDTVEFHGQEVDSEILQYYSSHSSRMPASLRQMDYFQTFEKNPHHLVCNPPYLKFQKIAQRRNVLESMHQQFGVSLSGYTNIASLFLVKSLCELTSGRRLAYIMPSEFLNAGYGKQIKEILIQDRHLVHLIQLECEQEAFPDATTSLCILLYDSAKRYDTVSFYTISSLTELRGILDSPPLQLVSYEQLHPLDKWGHFFETKQLFSDLSRKHFTSISNYGHFSRGIATGANDFFVLRKSEITKLSLSSTEYLSCITKSAQITRAVFTSDDFHLLEEQDAPVYLFNAGQEPSSAAKLYIQYGESRGFNHGYITRNRSPWYKMEQRAPAPIMLNVFSRDGYKVVRNLTTVHSLTSYHCFYPNLYGAPRIDAIFLYLLSSVGHSILSHSMRKYGNQLVKFEPNDLNQALAPTEAFLDSIPKSKIDDLTSRLVQGENILSEIDNLFQILFK